MTGDEMEAARAAMSQPSKVHLWLVNNHEVYWEQLDALLPNRCFVPPKDHGSQPLMAVYVPEYSVPIGTRIFADDDISDGLPPNVLSMWDEHTCRKNYGPWPWETA
ncbi:MAG: hypothetical protein DI624_13625 [Brevundimonas sp.]|uniref:hypothetical protein n=1 Tax=Brevundimonas sp. TaxID=1871086 RepID=UPI000DB73BA8|nr:hypothetical protein [Brevundimonas sp.]PZT95408.1 MAG: hypothetical protein DI624_13625 [Brevundimonas sp.]